MSYFLVKQDPVLGVNKFGPIEVNVFDRPKNLIGPTKCSRQQQYLMHQKKIPTPNAILTKKSSKLNWMAKSFDLIDFTPECSPYIPSIVTVLINLIERDCACSENWHTAYQSRCRQKSEEAELLGKIVTNNYSKADIINALIDKSAGFLTSMLRLFLMMFKTKLIHLNVEEMLELSQRPLHDKYLRPDTSMNRVFMKVFLKSPRIKIDTLSFLMLHISKCCRCSSNSTISRGIIAESLGPHVISYETSRKFFCGDIDVRIALLEFTFELFNNSTWDYLSQQEAKLEFYNISALNHLVATKGSRAISMSDFSKFELSRSDDQFCLNFKMVKYMEGKDLFPILNKINYEKTEKYRKIKRKRAKEKKIANKKSNVLVVRNQTIPELKFVTSEINLEIEEIALCKSISGSIRSKPQLDFSFFKPRALDLKFVKSIDTSKLY